MTTTANMTFRRYGHSYHLKIETAEALAHVIQLDEAHWVANNAPLNTIYCDSWLYRFATSPPAFFVGFCGA